MQAIRWTTGLIRRHDSYHFDPVCSSSSCPTKVYHPRRHYSYNFDAVSLPSAQIRPFPEVWDWPKEVAGQPADSNHRWMEVVVSVILAGLPCGTVPAVFASNGRPIGIQLATRIGEQDAKLLRLAQVHHAAVDWLPKQPAAVYDVLVGARPLVGAALSVPFLPVTSSRLPHSVRDT
jgi:hypothetical protein